VVGSYGLSGVFGMRGRSGVDGRFRGRRIMRYLWCLCCYWLSFGPRICKWVGTGVGVIGVIGVIGGIGVHRWARRSRSKATRRASFLLPPLLRGPSAVMA
jgi:hypothetical protein